ncbi:hypothetical protein [Nostoc sp. DedQUE09]|nr:hypothetical protein [Nostoc sp. DedQUE09]MDZ7956157.1 hypothetical protein [Nostoc sp. DedQUE09]
MSRQLRQLAVSQLEGQCLISLWRNKANTGEETPTTHPMSLTKWLDLDP